jgi:hypothetical protein
VIAVAVITVLISTVASYRVSACQKRTDALESMAPDSLNRTHSKVLFYLLHAAPEWLISTLVLTVNMRKTFGTGPFGDFRGVDETPAEKEKRLAREAKRAAKKAAESTELQNLTRTV